MILEHENQCRTVKICLVLIFILWRFWQVWHMTAAVCSLYSGNQTVCHSADSCKPWYNISSCFNEICKEFGAFHGLSAALALTCPIITGSWYPGTFPEVPEMRSRLWLVGKADFGCVNKKVKNSIRVGTNWSGLWNASNFLWNHNKLNQSRA